jgi:hypothetical protein
MSSAWGRSQSHHPELRQPLASAHAALDGDGHRAFGAALLARAADGSDFSLARDHQHAFAVAEQQGPGGDVDLAGLQPEKSAISTSRNNLSLSELRSVAGQSTDSQNELSG